ncbi:TonB-linked SusC/RagA family outer membrane protein [Neolewinella xylanilytica]|uniref:TonB-linked SusC/RagA family outer membrane protein n=1 Tax=Neolewinella xylanilytica TaxID=1514080 RepID=A0A2S6I1I8_9BACT|nr:TonB-dependent receptor [Neolewinella xylanilytica]PPK85046.1 TonB-linked SusC/RagA family outer membrane protein [Neolewinella xylanilytica]
MRFRTIYKSSGLLLLATLLTALSPAYGSVGAGTPPASELADQRQLLDVIKELEERYQVFFTYERSLLEDVEVHFDFREGESLEVAMERLLTETGFLHKTFGTKYLVIYRDTKAGRSGARKLGKAIKQLQELESSTKISVQRTTADPARQFQSVARGIAAAKQLISVSGRVTSTTGEVMIGATILVKGTSTGTVTDLEGDYVLANVNGSDTLIFSSIGYLTQQIPVNNRTTIDVQMSEDVAALDEVVVIGYGTQKKSDITGSVASVPKDRLENLPVTNVLQAIQGTTAGLQVSQGSSAPGASAQIQVRGVNSINASNSPFIVLDGAPFFGQTNDINANDIESIEILKDASAVAIYGTRGANGVILITTKRGKTGKPRIGYSGYVAAENMINSLEFLGPDAYVQKYADYVEAFGLDQGLVLPNLSEIENYEAGTSTDWLDLATKTGILQEHNLSISGGTDDVQYYVTAGRLDQDGVVEGYNYQRTSVRTNLDATLTDWLSAGTSLAYTNNNYDGGRANFLAATAMSPFGTVYNETGGYEIFPMAPELLFENPLLGLTTDQLRRRNNLIGGGYLELSPGFLPGLSYRLNGNYTLELERNSGYSGRAANNTTGFGFTNNSQTDNWVLENILNYNREFGASTLGVTALYSAQESEYFWVTADANTFVNDQLSYYNLQAAENYFSDSDGNSQRLVSQMLRVNYGYDSRYLLTLTARRDGFSAFGSNTDKYGLFPSVALGWNVTNESFLDNVSWLDNLKVRFSYGQSGNQAIDPNQTATTANPVRYPFGGVIRTGVLAGRLGNANLNWETTTSANLGIDFSLWAGRLSGSLEVYQSRTEDILLQRSLPIITGSGNIWDNLGVLDNRGIEFTFNSVNVRAGKFRWESSFNIASNQNELIELYGDGQDDVGNNWFIGEPLQSIFDYRYIGVWQEGEDPSESNPGALPGDLKFEDVNGDGVLNPDDRVLIGDRLPDYYGGLTNTFHYGDFHLSVFLQTSQGGLRYNPDQYYGDEVGRRNIPNTYQYWTPDNPINDWPSLRVQSRLGSWNYRDPSYVRLKDVRLSYAVPSPVLDRLGMQALTVYVAGRNLYTWTDWIGWDPETNFASRGSDGWTNNYPFVRTYSFGVNLTL